VIEGDRQVGDIGKFEREVAGETGIDESGRRVDQQPEAAE